MNPVPDMTASWMLEHGAKAETCSHKGTTAFSPVIVSVGHGISLGSALELVRRVTRHRIPEPVRRADLGSREWLRTHTP